MTGYPDLNFPAFAKAAKELRERGHEVFCPSEVPVADSYRSQLLIDLTWIALHAEGMVLLKGWERSKGTNVEKALADAIGIPTWEMGYSE